MPEDRVDPAILAQMNDLVASGQIGSGKTDWLRILAHHPDPAVVEQHLVLNAKNGKDGGGLLGSELRELLRLANAQLVGCDACSQARYQPELAEDTVACAVVGAGEDLSDRERVALAFQRQLHLDHWSIDDNTYRGLAEVFSTAEVVELTVHITTLMGSGRWLHTLQMLSDAEPIVAWDHTPSSTGRA